MGSADQIMNSHLVSEPLVQRKGVISVTTLRNSRALFILRKACALSLMKRGLNVEYFIRNLLRPDLISASLAGRAKYITFDRLLDQAKSCACTSA